MAALASVGVVAATYSPTAEACGGCFHSPTPPGESASVVTDHRMIMAVSAGQSTLYDQIRYQGSPGEFAWILPISGTVEVGTSDDSLFGSLDALTSVLVVEPPRRCPTLPPECFRGGGTSSGFASSASSASSSSSSSGGVTVIKEEVVGPYATVQLKPASENDTAAVLDWLSEHDYVVQSDVTPVIQYYVSRHYNFLALRLKPDESVNAMRPVRVTTKGSNVALPLRMVAAGTGATVGVTLWVVSGGRFEPTNFESFTLRDEDLAWNWAANASNYKDLRAAEQAKNPGRRWEVESVITTVRSAIESGAFLSQNYLDETNDAGTKPASEIREDDYDTLTSGYGQGSLWVTRLRADLSRQALGSDLTIGASANQSLLNPQRRPQAEIGEPLCPVIKGCQFTGEQLPRSQAVLASTPPTTTSSSSGSTPNAEPTAAGNETDGTFTCASSPTTGVGTSIALGFIGVVAVSTLRGRRRRSR